MAFVHPLFNGDISGVVVFSKYIVRYVFVFDVVGLGSLDQSFFAAVTAVDVFDGVYLSTISEFANLLDADGRNITNEVRKFRNRAQVNAIKDIHCRHRSKEGLVQRTQAHHIEHEDVPNDILGENYNATNIPIKQWMNKCHKLAKNT
jgi:hypothetical protein